MKLTWMGHACFLIEGSGVTWLTDPYDAEVGYPQKPVYADFVTMSHDHHDHNDASWVEGNPQIVRASGSGEICGLPYRVVDTFHDGEGGSLRGGNRIFVVEMDGLRIAHLGDLGHALSPEQLAQLGSVDVALIPVGGTYTLDAPAAAQVAAAIGAPLTVAMHFKLPEVQLPIADVSAFLALTGGAQLGFSAMEIDGGLTGRRTVALTPASLAAPNS